jgi:hypothetical protein
MTVSEGLFGREGLKESAGREEAGVSALFVHASIVWDEVNFKNHTSSLADKQIGKKLRRLRETGPNETEGWRWR